MEEEEREEVEGAQYFVNLCEYLAAKFAGRLAFRDDNIGLPLISDIKDHLCSLFELFTRAPQESPSQKMQATFSRQKGGHGPRRSMRGPRKLGTRARSS